MELASSMVEDLQKFVDNILLAEEEELKNLEETPSQKHQNKTLPDVGIEASKKSTDTFNKNNKYSEGSEEDQDEQMTSSDINHVD